MNFHRVFSFCTYSSPFRINQLNQIIFFSVLTYCFSKLKIILNVFFLLFEFLLICYNYFLHQKFGLCKRNEWNLLGVHNSSLFPAV